MTNANATTKTAKQAKVDALKEFDARVETKQFSVDDTTMKDKFVDAYVYMTVTRIKAGLEAFDHWVTVGESGWFLAEVKEGTYKAGNPNWRTEVNAMFGGTLTKDEINYSVRMAGHVQKKGTAEINTQMMKNWLTGLAIADADKTASRTYVSCRRMVEGYNKHVKDTLKAEQDAKQGDNEENEEGDNKDTPVLAIAKDVINALKDAIKQDVLCIEQKSYKAGDRAKIQKMVGELSQSLIAGLYEENQTKEEEKPEVKKEA